MKGISKVFFISCLLSQIPFVSLKACQINFFQKTYYIKERRLLVPSDLIENSNCNENLQKKITELVLNSEGPLRASYLKKASELSPLEILPERFELIPLMSSLNLSKNWMWENIKILNGPNIFHGNGVSVTCSLCTGLGKKVLEIKAGKTTFWANGDLKEMAPVLVSKSTIATNKGALSPNDFDLVTKPVSNPDDYFTSIEEIKFYKLNLDLSEGTALKKSNLRKIDLITPGSPVTLKFINGEISIRGVGIPMSSGKIGETIKVKNQKSDVILFGKVVGENTVTVDL